MDEFEHDLSRMLQERVSAMPETYDAPPALLARAHRRRTARLSVLVVTVGLVTTGTTAAVAQIVGRQGSARLVTSPTESPTTTLAPSTTFPPTVSTSVGPAERAHGRVPRHLHDRPAAVPGPVDRAQGPGGRRRGRAPAHGVVRGHVRSALRRARARTAGGARCRSRPTATTRWSCSHRRYSRPHRS